MIPTDSPCAWAIRRPWLELVARGVPAGPPAALKALGPVPSAGPVRRVAGLPVGRVGAVAVLPLYGVVTQRPTWLSDYGLAMSAEQFAAAHAELVADPSVSAVVWDVDSPGGSVAGVPEAADRLYALRGRKRTVAVSNAMMASAAYWLASAADEIAVTPSSLTGSIGVYTTHVDQSRANDKAGVAVTYVFAGKRKVDGHPDAPLSDAARSAKQQQVDDYYGQFAGAVARHRGTTAAAVRDGYGEGDVLTARRAVAAGLADRVETLSQVLARLGGGSASHGPQAAARGTSLALAEAIQRNAAALV